MLLSLCSPLASAESVAIAQRTPLPCWDFLLFIALELATMEEWFEGDVVQLRNEYVNFIIP